MISESEANVTFVIQASKEKKQWHTMVAFRQLKGQCEVTWRNKKAYKFWRYVLVDHSGNKSWYSGIGWFVLTKELVKTDTLTLRTQVITNGFNVQ
jgi:hypothetical protein